MSRACQSGFEIQDRHLAFPFLNFWSTDMPSTAEYHRRYYREVRRPKVLAALGGRCVVCGATENLEFDHVDPAAKEFEIKDRLSLQPRTLEELAKCQLLCTEHHREKTAAENTGITHGSTYAWLTMKCRCEVCADSKRLWQDERNARRRSAGAARRAYSSGPRQHGEFRTYRAGCRCQLCKDANAVQMRAYRAANRK